MTSISCPSHIAPTILDGAPLTLLRAVHVQTTKSTSRKGRPRLKSRTNEDKEGPHLDPAPTANRPDLRLKLGPQLPTTHPPPDAGRAD